MAETIGQDTAHLPGEAEEEDSPAIREIQTEVVMQDQRDAWMVVAAGDGERAGATSFEGERSGPGDIPVGLLEIQIDSGAGEREVASPRATEIVARGETVAATEQRAEGE